MSSRTEIQPQDQSSPPAKKARIESPSGVVDTPNNAASTSSKVSLLIRLKSEKRSLVISVAGQ